MEKIYKVVFVYPDGHIEELEEEFKSGAEALDCGNSMLAQVPNMERYRNPFDVEKREPSFSIVEVNGKKHKVVYSSK